MVEFIINLMHIQESYRNSDIKMSFTKTFDRVLINIWGEKKALYRFISEDCINNVASLDELFSIIDEMIEEVRRA